MNKYVKTDWLVIKLADIYGQIGQRNLHIIFSYRSVCKEILSNSPGPVDFAIGLVNFVLNLPNGQVKFFDKFKLQKNCEFNSSHQNVFGATWNDVWASIIILTSACPNGKL